MMLLFKEVLSDLLQLLYPNICLACNQRLNKQEEVICLFCKHDLPQTDFHHDKENLVARHLWGRIQLDSATSFLSFSKGGKVQALIHQLKYKQQHEVGVYLGKWYAEVLKRDGTHTDIDLIIPVPMHPSKIKTRGYNQCDVIAQGLSEGLGVPWSASNLVKGINNETQTRKSRFQRWINASNTYHIHRADELKNKRVLLVDDVITTGATLEACGHQLLAISGLKLHIATIACAQQLL